MTIVPMVVGFFFAKYVLKLSLLNNLGSITGGMTSTPALGTLINVSGTEDVAAAYAATYPVALIAVVLRKVNNLQSCRLRILLPELATLTMSRAEEECIYSCQIVLISKAEVCLTDKSAMNITKGIACIGCGVYKSNLYLRMVHK
jgi:hypothetical protein